MQDNKIDLLVTFDQNYIGPFQTMLKSAVMNNPGEQFHIWLLHSGIPEERLQDLNVFCRLQDVSFTPVPISRQVFEEAPVSKQYPQEMYYRLLAPHLLPAALKKVLYLDPDILVINPLRPLWEIELNGNAFAAASHTGVLDIMNGINRIRLNTDHDYYNSGVMLMDLDKARKIIKAEEIFECVSKHELELLLPDQDVFNYLYGMRTLQVDDAIWNYDARYYSDYLIRSSGSCHMDWIMKNTVILHFCGKRKPWKPSYTNRFASLYKHYMQIALRDGTGLSVGYKDS